ncbi:HAMP domain-containing histidine kinase [Stenotrophomonas sp. SAM-B]|uniref:sensor histidine kinase n=1 Tax=Stenotrophomonas sp. SAM-B TaxID=2729141 RepID=UPI0015A4DA00|nr:HAMP domain-containing sensor histidine kinase [Stenotrophomonas sp. SAM-B]NWF35041.1 HAMP domain-containing histidine kinase [Stenotrophomonas sp. SAM-B]
MSDHWRSSSSRLLGLYCVLFVAWSSVLLGVMYWRVSDYLNDLAESGLQQRAHLFEKFEGQALDDALRDSLRYDLHGAYAYGIFSRNGQPLSGPLLAIPDGLRIDGHAQAVERWSLRSGPIKAPGRALGVETQDGRLLVFVRQSGKLTAVNSIILDALLWGVSLTVLPGLAGWHILRRRPLRRIQEIEAATNRIIAGDLGQRLPISGRPDEIDRLSSIVNAMLERIEQLMTEVKGVCDSIAHDLRTPLTRLRAHLYRTRVGLEEDDPRAAQLDKALTETDMLMARFSALLRVSELESHQRRSAFVQIDVTDLLQELHQFYLPLAEEKQQQFTLRVVPGISMISGDRELLFEALANLLSNALHFAPEHGQVLLRALDDDGAVRIDVIDNGPGIPPEERSLIYQRFFRGSSDAAQGSGFGLGLSIVAAIAGLHGFRLRAGSAPGGGAWLSIRAAADGLL